MKTRWVLSLWASASWAGAPGKGSPKERLAAAAEAARPVVIVPESRSDPWATLARHSLLDPVDFSRLWTLANAVAGSSLKPETLEAHLTEALDGFEREKGASVVPPALTDAQVQRKLGLTLGLLEGRKPNERASLRLLAYRFLRKLGADLAPPLRQQQILRLDSIKQSPEEWVTAAKLVFSSGELTQEFAHKLLQPLYQPSASIPFVEEALYLIGRAEAQKYFEVRVVVAGLFHRLRPRHSASPFYDDEPLLPAEVQEVRSLAAQILGLSRPPEMDPETGALLWDEELWKECLQKVFGERWAPAALDMTWGVLRDLKKWETREGFLKKDLLRLLPANRRKNPGETIEALHQALYGEPEGTECELFLNMSAITEAAENPPVVKAR